MDVLMYHTGESKKTNDTWYYLVLVLNFISLIWIILSLIWFTCIKINLYEMQWIVELRKVVVEGVAYQSPSS